MRCLVSTVFSLCLLGLILHADDKSSGAKTKIVFVLGEKEYGTLENVPKFFEDLLEPEGYTATFIVAQPEEEVRNDFSHLAEALKDADLAFISARRRAPEKEDIQALKNHVAAGKPLVAIRTSSHAFHLKGQSAPVGHDVWEEFDPEILGGNYNGHYREELATITVEKGAQSHPLLKGIGELPKSNKLYRVKPLADSTTLLLNGKIEGHEIEPVAWTNEAGDNAAKIFYTSLGQRSDFESAEFCQFLKQAIEWALD